MDLNRSEDGSDVAEETTIDLWHEESGLWNKEWANLNVYSLQDFVNWYKPEITTIKEWKPLEPILEHEI